MQQDFIQEQKYIKAKKRMKDIKGFYIHLFLYTITTPIIITVNLMFSPGFHWFWFSTLGWGLAIFLHWMGVFGFKKIGFGKDWEENKIKELMDKEDQRSKNI